MPGLDTALAEAPHSAPLDVTVRSDTERCLERSCMTQITFTILVHNGVHDLEQFPTRFPDLSEDDVREYLTSWFLGCNDGASFIIFA